MLEGSNSSSEVSPSKKTVVIAGGGIAGLTAATLLGEAGFRVILCERANTLGGKAKSARTPEGLPIEHSLRVYSASYHTLLGVLAKIPVSNGKHILDHLLGVRMLPVFIDGTFGPAIKPKAIAKTPGPIRSRLLRILRSFRQIATAVPRALILVVFFQSKGIPVRETFRYVYAHLKTIWACKERIARELGGISYSEYLDFPRRSAPFQKYFSAFPKAIVAARENAAATVIVQMMGSVLFGLANPPQGLEHLPDLMMMDGPTSERLIDPWVCHLRNLGIEIRLNTAVSDFKFLPGQLEALIMADGQILEGDYFLLSLPYMALRHLAIHTQLGANVPHLTEQHRISMEASNGMQCFLKSLPQPLAQHFRPGVPVCHMDSPWNLVSTMQGAGFWRNVEMPQGITHVLSLTWSSADSKGSLTGLTVEQCTPEQIFHECMYQTGFDSASVVSWHIDDELSFVEDSDYFSVSSCLPPHLASSPHNGKRLLNFSPLTILLPDSENFRGGLPRIDTEVSNLLLAGESAWSPRLRYLVPTMEKAANSGYVAAMSIISEAAPEAFDAVKLPLSDPLALGWLRKIDSWFWSRKKGMSSSTHDNRQSGNAATSF